MDRESTLDEPVTVLEGDVTVEKTFVSDEFPVPAVKFTITSTAAESTHIRLVDRIPESFPMERVGFHPEFDSGHWTAYKDHRVVYERTVAPEESVTTVYGVRINDDNPAAFLGAPLLQQRPSSAEEEFETIDGILGRDDGVVRDLLAGDPAPADRAGSKESAPEADAEPTAENAESTAVDALGDDIAAAVSEVDPLEEPDAEADPLESDAAATPPEEPDAEVGEDADLLDNSALAPEPDADPAEEFVDEGDAEPAAEPEPESEPKTELDVGPTETAAGEAGEGASGSAAGSPDEAASDSPGQAAAETGGDDARTDAVDRGSDVATVEGAPDTDAVRTSETTVGGNPGSLVAALAAELRDGGVDEDDAALLRDQLDGGVPRSVDVRIRRLQGQVNDIAAYSDALSEFIDGNGTGTEVIDDLQEGVDAMRAELGDLNEALSEADAERADLREDVDSVADDLGRVEERADERAERIETAEAEAADAAERVDGLDAAVEVHAERLDDVEDELGDVYDDVAALDGDIITARESVEGDVEELRGELADLRTQVAEVEAFRDRLSGVFGDADGHGGPDAE